VLAIVLAGCSADTDRRIVEGVAEVHTDRSFYALPDPVPAGAPGTIVRTEALPSTMAGSVAWRVLYHTTDESGTDRVVSAVVVAPAGPAPPGGRPVVGWGHPTTGAVARCAPSNGLDPFDLIEGLRDLLYAGYVVAAADYPGLGVEGQSSYLIGVTEGNSVLDAIRAARHLPEAGAGTDVLLWGHSQGGQAVLFAGQSIKSYAPELHLRAVAAAAPATELATLLDDHISDASGVTIGSYAYAAYQAVYPGASLASILTPAGVAATPPMAQLCLFGEYLALRKIADPLIGEYVAHDPATTEPWAGLLRQNTPGATPVGVPVFIAQGEADELVKPAATTQYVNTVCARGEHVAYKQYPGANHGSIARVAMADVLVFLAGALNGAPAAGAC
jgi:alpha-beta hydrolase superfamily lysophospholipase